MFKLGLYIGIWLAYLGLAIVILGVFNYHLVAAAALGAMSGVLTPATYYYFIHYDD